MSDIDAAAALGWRLARHGLGPVATEGVVDAVERVVATRAWPLAAAELALAIRRRAPQPGDLEEALARGDLVSAYAFRGGAYLFTPETARTLLTVRGTTRVWESARFQQQGGFAVEDWGPVRTAIRDAVADAPATRAEIAQHLRGSASLAHLADAAATGAGSDSLYKPLHWWGDLAFGPPRQGQATFRLLTPEPLPIARDTDAAGREAVLLYLRGYGPATAANLQYWLGEGLSAPRRRISQWLTELGDQVRTVTVAGEPAFLAAADEETIRSAEPSDPVALLPSYDPWLLGPGTADGRIVPPARRALLSAGGNPVLHGGVVCGTWRMSGQTPAVTWFDEATRPPSGAVDEAISALATARAAL